MSIEEYEELARLAPIKMIAFSRGFQAGKMEVFKIIDLLQKGKTVDQICSMMHLHEHYVKSIKDSITKK